MREKALPNQKKVWWAALKMGAAYLTGTFAPKSVRDQRLSVCVDCPTREIHLVGELDFVRGWSAKLLKWLLGRSFRSPQSGWPAIISCGPPGVDRTDTRLRIDRRSCGCLVGAEVVGEARVTLMVGGRMYAPAGKTTLLEQKCPQGKW